MLADKILNNFKQLPDLRVLFFFDATEEHRAEVTGMDLGDIKIVMWQHNDFRLKVDLQSTKQTQKVFLYLPIAAPQDLEDYKKFPLLGLLIANKALLLDDVGSFMDEFHLQPHHKNLVSSYIGDLKYNLVKEVCKPLLTSANLNEKDLIKGLLSAFLEFKSIQPWSLLLGKMLTLALPDQESSWKRFQKKVADNNLFASVRDKCQEYFGATLTELSQGGLKEILQRSYYNQITQGIRVSSRDPYGKLKMELGTLTYFKQFLQDIERSTVQDRFKESLAWVAEGIRGEKLIETYGAEANFAYYPTDMIWALMRLALPNLKISPTDSISRLQNLSLQNDLETVVQHSLHCMIQAATMHEHINALQRYKLDTPDAYLQQYTEVWMHIDTAYRKAIWTYRFKNLSDEQDNLDLETLIATLNSSYETHTETLNREWLSCLHAFRFDYKAIHAAKQYDFYKNEVAPFDQKVVVIISDGLRYEAAVELLASLHGDAKNTAEIRYQLASIPSKTNVGMAQLLPAETLVFNEGAILVDGQKTDGLDNRGKILSKYNQESLAVQFSTVNVMTQEEKRTIFKNKLVYVYHDVIDARGDKSGSEDRTFVAVEETIAELKEFVGKLHHTFGVAKVLITADHGFLYNDRKIDEKDKESSPNGKVLQNHNRFEISETSKSIELGYNFPLAATTKFNDKLFVTIPKSVNRYKLQGVGHQYVHGGGSLQELVVPIIDSSRKLKEVTKKVEVQLLSRGELRIVSSILRIDLLQKNKVSRFEKECRISVGLYKDAELASNEVFVLLNATADAPSERMHRIDLLLSSASAKESFLKLKVFDVEDKLNALIEESVQNNTLLETDF
jgi:uncharacterized protein (TIGR02687 family)